MNKRLSGYLLKVSRYVTLRHAPVNITWHALPAFRPHLSVRHSANNITYEECSLVGARRTNSKALYYCQESAMLGAGFRFQLNARPKERSAAHLTSCNVVLARLAVPSSCTVARNTLKMHDAFLICLVAWSPCVSAHSPIYIRSHHDYKDLKLVVFHRFERVRLRQPDSIPISFFELWAIKLFASIETLHPQITPANE